jgi:hypothetical protein
MSEVDEVRFDFELSSKAAVKSDMDSINLDFALSSSTGTDRSEIDAMGMSFM